MFKSEIVLKRLFKIIIADTADIIYPPYVPEITLFARKSTEEGKNNI